MQVANTQATVLVALPILPELIYKLVMAPFRFPHITTQFFSLASGSVA